MADIGRSGCRNVGSSMPWPGSLPAIATTQRSASSASRRAGPHGRAQVGLLAGEQAVADLAVGGEPDPVAGAAERPGHRGDDADRGRAAVDEEQLGRRAAARLHGGDQHVVLLERGQDLVGGDHLLAAPAVLGVQRHLLDEPQRVAALEAPLEQVGRLVVVDAAQQHGVHLHRPQAGGLGGLEAGHHVGEPVAPGDLVERVGADRVEADVDPVEAGVLERLRGLGQARARWWSARSPGAAPGPPYGARCRPARGAPAARRR